MVWGVSRSASVVVSSLALVLSRITSIVVAMVVEGTGGTPSLLRMRQVR
jgi:hypothetical protein